MLPALTGFRWGAGMQTSQSHTGVAAFGGSRCNVEKISIKAEAIAHENDREE